MNKDSVQEPRNHAKAYDVYPPRYYPDYDVERTPTGHLQYMPTDTQIRDGQVCESIWQFDPLQ